jgi:hypothetical protein
LPESKLLGMTTSPSPLPRQPLIEPEHGYLTLAAVSLPVALVLLVLDYVGAVAVIPGTYGILAALTAVGGCGWLVRSGDTRRRRDIAAVHERLSDIDARLAQVLIHSRGTSRALVYVGRAGAADGTHDTVDLSAVEAARAEGFAEGYVTGMSRGDEG